MLQIAVPRVRPPRPCYPFVSVSVTATSTIQRQYSMMQLLARMRASPPPSVNLLLAMVRLHADVVGQGLGLYVVLLL